MTSASPQPPPTVPTRPVSGSTSMRAPTFRGVEPLVATIVASTQRRPASRAATSASLERAVVLVGHCLLLHGFPAKNRSATRSTSLSGRPVPPR